MHPIEQALILAISKYPKIPLVVAYSGGVDSQVLLHALAKLKHAKQSSYLIPQPISVCHVNHGLSDNAMQWQNFAKQQCQQVNLPITVFQVNVQPQPQQSLEALARNARYKALQSLSTEPMMIITGHHSDDQAETFLLALKRGSGLKGLSAMAKSTKLGKDLLVRPLLNISRAQIVDYAKLYGLTWIEDESNSDNSFDRNFIRNDVMPLLADRWPSIANTINRSSEHCQEGQLLLDELAEEDLILCQYDLDSLVVKALSQLSIARFNNLIRYFLAQHQCLMPSTEQLAQLQQQLSATDDKNPAVKVAEHYFRRYKSVLYLTPNFENVNNWQAEVDLSCEQSVFELPDSLGELNIIVDRFERHESRPCLQSKGCLIAMPEESSKVSVRFSHDNPTCLPDYRHHSRSVKKVLQELNIPTWQRKRIPFLYYDDVLVAAIGYFVCQDYVVKGNESNIKVNWTP